MSVCAGFLSQDFCKNHVSACQSTGLRHQLVDCQSKIYDLQKSPCDRIHSSLIAVYCLDNSYVGKQPVAWKEYCAEYWLEKLTESMERCTGQFEIAEILLKTALNTIQSINQPIMIYNNFRMSVV